MPESKIHERSWVEIDLSAFRANLKALKEFLKPGQDFLQIVKADAYGHGALEISRIALEEGAVALGVANLEEGKLLRLQGCKAPILILSPSLDSEIEGILIHDLTPTISDLDFADKLNAAACTHNIHKKVQLKFDSGMHRSGALEQEFVQLWKHCQTLTYLDVEGLFSHFASGESDSDFCQIQSQRFQQILDTHKIKAPWIHIDNSSALINGHGSGTNLCRLGILSYGVYTHPSQIGKIDLQPVMTFKSIVTQIKTIPKGAGVGYNLSWIAPRQTTYAIVPVGYADGYDFMLSNCGVTSVRGVLCRVIGKVSMDMICIDVTDIPVAHHTDDANSALSSVPQDPHPALHTGEEVILLGGNTSAQLRAENLVAQYQGSSYELLCQVGRRAKRYYFEAGKLVTSSPLLRRDFVSSDYTDSKLNQIIQAAISQRMDSAELGEMISREILRNYFYNKDQEILYRKNFCHSITFQESEIPGYFRTLTTLSFQKTLQNDFFTVACATSEQALKSYFQRRDVEYRWLMDANFSLNPDSFKISSVRINDLNLDTGISYRNSCMEIRCTHPGLPSLVGSEVSFQIDTITLYPKSSHQLSVFITELTHGVKISFAHPESLVGIETIPVFSGQNKYPQVRKTAKSITVFTKPDEWVFPQSGVVFAY